MDMKALEQWVIDWLTSEGLNVGGAPLARGTSLLTMLREVEREALDAGRREAMASTRTIDIVFDGPVSEESGRFVEVEQDGRSICVGEWVDRGDGMWALRIPNVG